MESVNPYSLLKLLFICAFQTYVGRLTLPKDPEEAKKVLLDTELDLISAQGSGDDITTLELR